MTDERKKPMTETQREVRRLRKMLSSMAELATHSSLTGSLEGGAAVAVRRYNGILQQLERRGILKDSFFDTLPENTNFEELGVDCTLLAGYLAEVIKEDEDEPEGFSWSWNKETGDEEHEEPTQRQAITSSAQQNEAVSRELDELRRLGQVIREHLPEWLTERASAAETGSQQQGRLASAEERGDGPAPAALPEPSPGHRL